MKKLEYSIDQKEYDVLVLGTGMTEALFAASLAKIDRKKVLIIDADNGYSSSQKTLNLKELLVEQAKTRAIVPKEESKEEDESKCDGKQECEFGNLKRSFFSTLGLPEEIQAKNDEFMNHAIKESSLYKQFNIDIQPKLLFSNSLTVDCMSQANMDQYMEFRAVNSIYFFESTTKKLISTPCSKSDIFKSKEFGLLEKKQLFQFLHKCVSLYRLAFAEKINQNSIEEFDKEFEVDATTLATYERLKDKPCIEFLASQITSKKVQDIFLYNLCNFDFNPNLPIPRFLQHAYTTNAFLQRLNKYIKSCGIHTPLPYLYANYGTGDIPQGFARISAIFGSVYCINEDIQIAAITKEQTQDEKHLFNILSNLVSQDIPKETQTAQQQESKSESVSTSENQGEQQQEGDSAGQIDRTAAEQSEKPIEEEKQKVHAVLPVKCIIAGPEYRDKIRKLLDLPIEAEEKQEKVKLLRVVLISKKSEEQLKKHAEFDALDLSDEELASAPYRFSCPIIYSIPPNMISGNKQPIQIVQMSSSTVSAPKSHQVFYCKKILENAENHMDEVNAIVRFVENIHTYLPVQPFTYSVDYVWAYTQEKTSEGRFERVQNEGEHNQQRIAFVGQDYFETDMDKNFEEFRDNIEWLSEKVNTKDENYFRTIEEMNGKVDFYQNQIGMDGEEDCEEQEGIDNFIHQFQKLKENAQQQQQQQSQEQEKQEEKEQQDQVESANSCTNNRQDREEGEAAAEKGTSEKQGCDVVLKAEETQVDNVKAGYSTDSQTEIPTSVQNQESTESNN